MRLFWISPSSVPQFHLRLRGPPRSRVCAPAFALTQRACDPTLRRSPNARRPDSLSLPRAVHGTALRRHLQRLLPALCPSGNEMRLLVAARCRDRAPLRRSKTHRSYQRTLRRSRASLTAVELLVQLRQPPRHAASTAGPSRCPDTSDTKRHMPRLADQDAKPTPGGPFSCSWRVHAGQLARRLRVMWRIEVRRVEREHVRGKPRTGNAAFATATCACSN